MIAARQLRAVVPSDLRYRADGWLMDGGHRSRAYAALRGRSGLALPEDTELVIEGFPRSANTYAYVAFWIANGREITVAHHTHAGMTVWLGVRRRLPVVVLVRHPADAVSSWLLFRPELSARSALHAYLRFHQMVVEVHHQVVVAPFDVVVGHFSAVTEAVNRQFGTAFAPYEATAENEARIRHETEWWDHERSGHLGVREATVSRPSAERQAARSVALARVHHEVDLVHRADRLYRQVMTRAIGR